MKIINAVEFSAQKSERVLFLTIDNKTIWLSLKKGSLATIFYPANVIRLLNHDVIFYFFTFDYI